MIVPCEHHADLSVIAVWV